MPKEQLKIFPYDHSFPSDEYVNSAVRMGEGPLIGTLETRKASIRKQLQTHAKFLAHMDAEGSLESISRDKLNGSGSVGYEYGTMDRNGEITASAKSLTVNPSGVFFPETRNSEIYKIGRSAPESPSIIIGLFGDAQKMKVGQDAYMTHIAVVRTDSDHPEALTKAARNSRRRGYKLANINANLDPNQFSQRMWDKLRKKAKKRAAKLLKEKLDEDKPVSKTRRRVRELASGAAGAVFGVIIKSVYDNAPGIIRGIEDIIKYLVHPVRRAETDLVRATEN